MFNKIKEYIMSLITSRLIFLLLAVCILCGILIYRVFTLQIIEGEKYLNNFELQIKKEKTIDAARGNIYDRNNVLLAYNKLAYSVKIEDVFESGKKKNDQLNGVIVKLIRYIEASNDEVIVDFSIYLDEDNNYKFSLSGTRLDRFKADIYGRKYVTDMKYEEQTADADDIIAYMAGDTRYDIDTEKLSKADVLKIISIRYSMAANSYQKYIATTVANNVSDKTVAVIMENSEILDGVSIAEDTIRVYPTGVYTSQIIGYTGKVSQDELEALREVDESYTANDIVGKIGIEKSMETELCGTKGSETVYVDTMGKVILSDDYKEPTAGNDLYLTIDSELQEAVYHILEQKIAGILLKKITNTKEYIPSENSSSSDITIPIYDVYYALFNNDVIDLSHLSADGATENEKSVYSSFCEKKQLVIDKLMNEMLEKRTAYNKLTVEYQVYQNYLESLLIDKGILVSSAIDKDDLTYKAWAIDETISFSEYIEYAISKSWIDVTVLDLDESYSDSKEIFEEIKKVLLDRLNTSTAFDKLVYKYTIREDRIKAKQICMLLLEQNVISIEASEAEKLETGKISSYEFMVDRIRNLDITPAQLALDPYSASMVITDVNNGDILALVSYPSYDNNFLANGADANYLKKINNDLSKPLINYATMQRTAPGSTYKMVSAIAGLEEGVVDQNKLITCVGTFDETTDIHKCWISPGQHGPLNITNAIRHSCNYYFYTVGFKLSLDDNGIYNSDKGIASLAKYASMFGLDEKSGAEIEEYTPQISTMYSVPSAIGQGTNNFTTIALARYTTAVANSGTCYNLTLLDKLTDSNGNLLNEYRATVRNQIDISQTSWNVVHEGMRRVIQDKSYYNGFGVNVAGKTGTAQEDKTRADHGLFVCYAPYEKPQIAIAARIACGYSSEYVAETAKEVLAYYFDLKEESEVLTGTASTIEATHVSGD